MPPLRGDDHDAASRPAARLAPMTGELTDEQIDHLRDVLVEHGSVWGASYCQLCGVARCEIWVDAFDQLAAAGALMVDPSDLPPRPPERAP